MSETRIMNALRAISVQIMEVEKRIEGLELRLRDNHWHLDLLGPDDEEESSSEESSEGYESAPATFSYPES